MMVTVMVSHDHMLPFTCEMPLKCTLWRTAESWLREMYPLHSFGWMISVSSYIFLLFSAYRFWKSSFIALLCFVRRFIKISSFMDKNCWIFHAIGSLLSNPVSGLALFPQKIFIVSVDYLTESTQVLSSEILKFLKMYFIVKNVNKHNWRWNLNSWVLDKGNSGMWRDANWLNLFLFIFNYDCATENILFLHSSVYKCNRTLMLLFV